MQENQQVVFLSDGGEDIRQVREPAPQQRTCDRLVSHHHAADSLATTNEDARGRTAQHWRHGLKEVESIKHLLWHENVENALEHLTKRR